MNGKRRSAREITAELLKLADRPDSERNRVTLLHEVRVYQEELTVQNEELLHAQAALEETRDHFIELFDFAPNGYLTLDEHGVILRINLTGAAMLGRARQAIEGMPLLGFVDRSERATMMDFLRRCRRAAKAEAEAESCDIPLRTFNGRCHVQMICRPRFPHRDGRREFYMAIVDLTERRALERAREDAAHERATLAQRLITTQEAERQRIARDLHDNIGQQVTAMRLRLDSLAARDDIGSEAHAALGDAQQALGTLDRTIDFISSELRPASLDLGFLQAIQHFAHDWSTTFGIPVNLEANDLDSMRLRPEIETHVYRVVQEALHNVYKHAESRHARIVIERDGTRLAVTVQDKGKGFGAEPGVLARRGIGLASMRERAAIIGGVLHVVSSAGKGTSVSLIVPNAVAEGSPGARRDAGSQTAGETRSASPSETRAASTGQSRIRRTPKTTRNSFSPLSPSSSSSRNTRR